MAVAVIFECWVSGETVEMDPQWDCNMDERVLNLAIFFSNPIKSIEAPHTQPAASQWCHGVSIPVRCQGGARRRALLQAAGTRNKVIAAGGHIFRTRTPAKIHLHHNIVS